MWIYRLEFSLNKDLPPLSLTRLGLSKLSRRGVRMQKGLPVRFQRSKTNNRGSVVKIWLQVSYMAKLNRDVTRTEMLGNL